MKVKTYSQDVRVDKVWILEVEDRRLRVSTEAGEPNSDLEVIPRRLDDHARKLLSSEKLSSLAKTCQKAFNLGVGILTIRHHGKLMRFQI